MGLLTGIDMSKACKDAVFDEYMHNSLSEYIDLLCDIFSMALRRRIFTKLEGNQNFLILLIRVHCS
jgi:hypothetical protein